MTLEFAFDSASGDAFMIGNAGASKVFAVPGERGVSFLEALSSGAGQACRLSAETLS